MSGEDKSSTNKHPVIDFMVRILLFGVIISAMVGALAWLIRFAAGQVNALFSLF